MGDRLLGSRYEVLEGIARGGEGTVQRAFDRMEGRLVALKLCAPGTTSDALLALAPHPNLVRTTDAFDTPDHHVRVMELVDGPTLEDEAHDGALPRNEVVALLAGVAAALDHLHAGGGVHGDVTPANIIIVDDTAVLVDVAGGGPGRGTVGFTAPEVGRGDPPSVASDVWGLAATAVAALTGKPAAAATDVPSELRHGLATDPAKRPGATALVEGLRLPRARTNITTSRALVGRRREQRELARLTHTHRLVTITGGPGAGKTALATAVADQRLAEGIDGVWLVDLAAISEDDPSAVAVAIARAAAVPLDAATPALDKTVAGLSRRRHVVVLDNCEHVLRAARTVATTLVERCAQVRVVATSRRALGADEERTVDLGRLDDADACELFTEVAGVAVEAGALDHLDGLPLPIELAAARARDHGIETLRMPLDLAATIDASLGMLSPEAVAAFEACSLLPAGIPLNAVAELQGAEAAAAVTKWTELGLVAGAGAHRVRMLEPVRQRAEARLRARDGAGAAVRALRSWAHEAAETGPWPTREWGEWMTVEYDNVASLLASTDSDDDPVYLDIALWASSFERFRGFAGVAGAALERCTAGGVGGKEGRAKALSELAATAGGGGTPRDAMPLFAEAVALFEEAGDEYNVVDNLAAFAGVWLRNGDYDTAKPLIDEAVQRLPRVSDQRLAFGVHIFAGDLCNSTNDWEGARRHYAIALDAAREFGVTNLLPRALVALAGMLTSLGEHDAAAPLFDEALDLVRAGYDLYASHTFSHELAFRAFQLGDYAEARRLYQRSVAHAREVDARYIILMGVGNLCETCRRQGDLDAARGYLRALMEMAREMGQPHIRAAGMNIAGVIASAIGQTENAVVLITASARLYAEVGAEHWPGEPMEQAAAALATARAELGDVAFAALEAEASSDEGLEARYESVYAGAPFIEED